MAAILDLSKMIFSKTEASFLEISKENIFIASNTNISKNRVEKKKLEETLSKTYFYFNL